MKVFAHWKNVTASRDFIASDGTRQRDVVDLQTGPGSAEQSCPIRFVIGIPDEVTRDEVVAWVLKGGIHIDGAMDGLEFEEEWPRGT